MPIALRLTAQSAMQGKTAIDRPSSDALNPVLERRRPSTPELKKIARLHYRMLKFGKAYVETDQQAYEKLFAPRGG
jgi:hypothetical protein